MTATYQVRRLQATLPPEVRIPSIVAAARASLMERGYSIQSATATEDQGNVSALPPDAGWFESMEVKVWQSAAGPTVRIIAEPIGNQAKSRVILDSILAQLGR